ncbi:hypothetical protein MNV49_007658 [Pseudohyphozyma bogoriensis]|nr:hypothetical protein MNV49_007658 [Pseudohyphozyma bogoriensis]
MQTSPLLGTHSGTFHCDEALAVFLLRQLPTYKDSSLVRTRDPKKLEECDVVVDVGGVYDVQANRFDHHQRGFNEVFGEGYKTKLSSAGLVYKHFARDILANHLSLPVEHPTISTLYPKLYTDFIEALDAIDNGIPLFPASLTAGTSPAYRSRTDLSSRVGHLNPSWNEETSDEILDNLFEKASKLAGEEFLGRVDYAAKSWLPAKQLVQQAVEKRFEVDASGKVVLFESFAPWKEHLYNLESELSIPESQLPLYILYPESTSPTTNWRIQAVPVSADSFESRKALPEAWRGIRDEKLDELTGGQPGAIFVHAAGFIGGHKTKEGALELAIKALAL